jgi:putative ABC transport system permease protein
MCIPLAQMGQQRALPRDEITIAVRPVSGAPASLAPSVGASLASLDPNLSFSFRPFADVVRAAFATERLVALLSGVFALLALTLAGIGLYGVSSYTVSQRRTEIGVRMALGATPAGVVQQVMRQLVILTGLGVIEGTVISLWVLPFVSSLLYGLAPHDPCTVVGASLVLLAVGLVAGAFPAWRAVRIEPVEALREGG